MSNRPPERQLHPKSQHCLPLQGPSSHTPAPINPLTFASFPAETQAVHAPVSPKPGPPHPPQATGSYSQEAGDGDGAGEEEAA